MSKRIGCTRHSLLNPDEPAGDIRFRTKEALDRNMLKKVARALKISPEAIDGSTNNNSNYNHQCTFNPFDNVVESYEALLKSEREKIALLEKMLNNK